MFDCPNEVSCLWRPDSDNDWSDHYKLNFPDLWKIPFEFFAKIDPNWATAIIEFDDQIFDHDKDLLGLFNYRYSVLTRAILNGPKYGDVPFNYKLQTAIPCELLAQIRDVLVRSKEQCFKIFNPNHRVEILNGQTVILFEHCESGIVQNYDTASGSFDVMSYGVVWGMPPKQTGYEYEYETEHLHKYNSIQELLDELKDPDYFDAVWIGYLRPPLP